MAPTVAALLTEGCNFRCARTSQHWGPSRGPGPADAGTHCPRGSILAAAHCFALWSSRRRPRCSFAAGVPDQPSNASWPPDKDLLRCCEQAEWKKSLEPKLLCHCSSGSGGDLERARSH